MMSERERLALLQTEADLSRDRRLARRLTAGCLQSPWWRGPVAIGAAAALLALVGAAALAAGLVLGMPGLRRPGRNWPARSGWL